MKRVGKRWSATQWSTTYLEIKVTWISRGILAENYNRKTFGSNTDGLICSRKRIFGATIKRLNHQESKCTQSWRYIHSWLQCRTFKEQVDIVQISTNFQSAFGHGSVANGATPSINFEVLKHQKWIGLFSSLKGRIGYFDATVKTFRGF